MKRPVTRVPSFIKRYTKRELKAVQRNEDAYQQQVWKRIRAARKIDIRKLL